MITKFYRYCLIYKYNFNCTFTFTFNLILIVLLDPFQDFYFNSLHSESSKMGSSRLIKDYIDQSFCKFI